MEMARDAAAAFEQFVEGYRTSLRLTAAGMCGDWYTADDLVQDTLMILWRHWLSIEPAARIAYARTVLARLVTQERKSSRRHHESFGMEVESILRSKWRYLSI
jgi:DNA-directed RNA polymerase specialized sigma24 family protein